MVKEVGGNVVRAFFKPDVPAELRAIADKIENGDTPEYRTAALVGLDADDDICVSFLGIVDPLMIVGLLEAAKTMAVNEMVG